MSQINIQKAKFTKYDNKVKKMLDRICLEMDEIRQYIKEHKDLLIYLFGYLSTRNYHIFHQFIQRHRDIWETDIYK